MEKIREKFQILKAKNISLEELVNKQQEYFFFKLNKTLDSTTDSATESKSIKTEEKIVIAFDQEIDIQSKQVLQTPEEVPTKSQTLVQPQTRTMVKCIK
ncbi:hypothetical protein D8674_014016 [Pyrus ussuriensis x Pyrus communis]|uniref:Uncharacterized protein n=1 Tax=Pyrus ussuriensis x Pyrus communis TaxID=2448454 RepID=A0A5N5GSL0_9ROSA|nr:hypothetical protein D8674_014016 [Pyrus ussuriensis x Pyrus communis]